MLTLDVQWLADVARLASDPSDPEPDWPPQPDRVFSALVASWGALGEGEDGRRALEWLESQEAPELLAAPMASARPSVDVYVPVNDQRAERALPDMRSRQARRFAACTLPPVPVHLRLRWKAAADEQQFRMLNELASATSYVGHSASLVRMQFSVGDGGVSPNLALESVRAAPHRGRLSQLEKLHRRHMAGDARARPRPAPRLAPRPASVPRSNVLSAEWLVLAHADGDRPDLCAAAALARRLREAIVSALPQPPPDWASGHEPDGAPARAPHMAIAPLANVGWEHADGRLMGLAVILPHAVRSGWNDRTPEVWKEKRDFEGAIEALKLDDGALRLKLGRAGVWRLRPEPEPTARSLDASRYTWPARVFHTVTPIALDRHLKNDGAAALDEAAEIIRCACANIGLPKAARVSVFKHSAVRGAPSAWPGAGAPPRPTWFRPEFLKERKLVHARIEFAEDVDGPLILGAGRFAGLGLCLPARDRESE